MSDDELRVQRNKAARERDAWRDLAIARSMLIEALNDVIFAPSDSASKAVEVHRRRVEMCEREVRDKRG